MDDGVGKKIGGLDDVLHDLSEAHRFVHARYREGEVLHHAAHHAVRIRCVYKAASVSVGQSKDTKARSHIAQPSPGSHSSGRSPSRRDCQSHSLWSPLWRTSGRTHLTGCVLDRWTTHKRHACKFTRSDIREALQAVVLTIRRTDSRHEASWIASEHDVVVFPDTPPLEVKDY